MVSVQAGCPLSHAIVLMETRAAQTHQPLTEIAAAIIRREIRFGS